MALSPIIAGVALLVPVAADWGAYRYVPAIVWFVILVQCVITFRWRGLWFLLGLPIAFVAIEAFLVAAPPVAKREVQAAGTGPDGPPAAKTGAPDAGSGSSKTAPPLIIHNPDGTFTVQKQSPKGATEDNRDKGLTIPPQVVVPTARMPISK